MDTGKGVFRSVSGQDVAKLQEAERTAHPNGVFQEGEVLEIRGSRFKVEKLNRTHMVLRLQRYLPETR